MTGSHDSWVKRDAAVVWHGFTQMAAYPDNVPVVVERAEGRELIDVHDDASGARSSGPRP